MDLVFKALADPTRRHILKLLRQREMLAGELAAHFGISAPSMSHHFNLLKQAELVTATRKGQQIVYALNTTVFQDVMSVLLNVFSPEPGETVQPGEEPILDDSAPSAVSNEARSDT